MTIEPKHLSALRCPVTKRPIELLSKKSLDALNSKILQASVTDNGGRVLSAELEQALITDTGTTIYPMINGVPVLIEAEGIAAVQIVEADGQ